MADQARGAGGAAARTVCAPARRTSQRRSALFAGLVARGAGAAGRRGHAPGVGWLHARERAWRAPVPAAAQLRPGDGGPLAATVPVAAIWQQRRGAADRRRRARAVAAARPGPGTPTAATTGSARARVLAA